MGLIGGLIEKIGGLIDENPCSNVTLCLEYLIGRLIDKNPSNNGGLIDENPCSNANLLLEWSLTSVERGGLTER